MLTTIFFLSLGGGTGVARGRLGAKAPKKYENGSEKGAQRELEMRVFKNKIRLLLLGVAWACLGAKALEKYEK